MIAIITLLLLLYLSLLMTRIATIILVYTGMPKDIARTQARSALTGTGFTTRESEMMVTNPTRRKLLMMLMLCGNIGIVATMATFILGFFRADSMDTLIRVSMLAGGLGLLWFLANSSVFEKWLDRILDHFITAHTRLAAPDFQRLCHLGGGYRIVGFPVPPGSPLASRTVATAFRDYPGMTLLGIEEPDGGFLGAPGRHVVIRENMTLIVYGSEEKVVDFAARFSAPPPVPPAEPAPPAPGGASAPPPS
ncbi:MAG TPA: TrkA C-terminal domain-containing protein [bacterium]|nr:TrkA C-terminal domain-containing protein [bacterium]HPJ71119.1 TrkA C-terminal domain-containing protein [bacterium]HPQ65746.1 TrkA C-terminal domain-containing protein [bacterium]